MTKRFLTLFCILFLFLGGCKSQDVIYTPSEMNSSSPTTEDSFYQSLNYYLDPFLQDGTVLPDTYEDHDLQWSIKSGNAKIEQNAIYKTEDALEYEPISLSVIVDQEITYEFDHLLLLDPYVAYIISYFSENGEEKEMMKLAYTYNGVYWFKFNEDHAVLKPTMGTKRLRDPSLARKKDGTFVLLTTQGYDTNSIYVYDSQDLLTFENERILKVNASSDKEMSETQAWAPEAFYDRTLNQYVIYWSSVEDGGMFYNMTDDFQSFSYPKQLLDTGFPVIDGTIVKENNDYYIVLKDEQEPMSTHSQLFLGKSENGWQDFNEFHSPFTGHQSEGPMVLKDLYVSGYFIIYDDYTRFQFQALKTEDLWNGPYKKVDSDEIMFPIVDPAHSSALPITWKELERLLEFYDLS